MLVVGEEEVVLVVLELVVLELVVDVVVGV